MTPAAQPSSRIANASTGVGSGRGSTPRLEPGAGHHLGGVAGEDVAAVPGVVADHHGAARRPCSLQVRRQAGRGADHDDPVHPVRTRAERAAQPRGAELQGAGEPVGQVGRVGAALDVRDDLPRARPGWRRRGPRPPRRAHARAGRRWPLRSSCGATLGSCVTLRPVPRPPGGADRRPGGAARRTAVRGGLHRPDGGRGPRGVRRGAAQPHRARLAARATASSTGTPGRTTGCAPGAPAGCSTSGTTARPTRSCAGLARRALAAGRDVSQGRRQARRGRHR